MRKLLISLIVLLSIFVFFACGAKGTDTPSVQLDFSFSEYYGLTPEEYFTKTGTTKNAFIEGQPGMGIYYSVNPVQYKDEVFNKYLLFDTSANVLYGGGYELVANNADESIFELCNQIKNDLIEMYGEPTTYDGLDNILSNMKNLSDVEAVGIAIERWSVTRNVPLEIPAYAGLNLYEELELSISNNNETVVIKIKHGLRASR